jgi:hypothetical protein
MKKPMLKKIKTNTERQPDADSVRLSCGLGGNSCGTFLLDCLPKIYYTPKNVLDYINKWKTVIGNPPFGKTK